MRQGSGRSSGRDPVHRGDPAPATEAASDLVFLDLPRRLAKFLLSQQRDDDGIVRLRLSQEQLAHRAGSTRQSVNAALRGFERRSWIEVHDRVIVVTQVAALARFAGVDGPAR